MACRYTLGDLRLRCTQRADKEGDASISVAEWNRLISEQYGELYSIVEKSGMRYFETEATVTATGAASYALPDDHLATIQIERVLDAAGHRAPRLKRLNVQERGQWLGQTGDARRYELAGTNLALYPRPSSGTYAHLYMPQAPNLSSSADSTNLDLVQADGLAFLTWGVTVKAMDKGEADVQVAMTEREAARDRFTEWCSLRAFTDAPRTYVERSDGCDDDWNPASFRWNPP